MSKSYSARRNAGAFIAWSEERRRACRANALGQTQGPAPGRSLAELPGVGVGGVRDWLEQAFPAEVRSRLDDLCPAAARPSQPPPRHTPLDGWRDLIPEGFAPLARRYRPDWGGRTEVMAALNNAREDLERRSAARSRR
jgi:hypothetical protein